MSDDQKASRRKNISNLLIGFAVFYSLVIVIGDFNGIDMGNTLTMYLYFLGFVASHEGINMSTPAGGFKK
jgi:hypothetical protein